MLLPQSASQWLADKAAQAEGIMLPDGLRAQNTAKKLQNYKAQELDPLLVSSSIIQTDSNCSVAATSCQWGAKPPHSCMALGSLNPTGRKRILLEVAGMWFRFWCFLLEYQSRIRLLKKL